MVALGVDSGQVVEAMAGRGFAEMFGGSPLHAIDILVAAADRVAPSAPEAAATLLVQAVVPCFMLTDLVRAEELTTRAESLARDGPAPLVAQVEAARAITDANRGRPREVSSRTRDELAG